VSWDRIWIETEDGSGLIERSEAERAGHFEQFSDDLIRLYDSGYVVVLVAGKNFRFDELFLFRTAGLARDLHHHGYRSWESFIGDSREECGFQEVTLYEQGRNVKTKSAPSTELKEAPQYPRTA